MDFAERYKKEMEISNKVRNTPSWVEIFDKKSPLDLEYDRLSDELHALKETIGVLDARFPDAEICTALSALENRVSEVRKLRFEVHVKRMVLDDALKEEERIIKLRLSEEK
jgi:hypothetical protein